MRLDDEPEFTSTDAMRLWEYEQAIANGEEATSTDHNRAREAEKKLNDRVSSLPLELIEASRRASAGDAYMSGQPWFNSEDMMLTGSPDKWAGHVVADFDLMGNRSDEIPSEDGCGLSEAKDDVRFAAMAWNYVRRLVAEHDRREMLL